MKNKRIKAFIHLKEARYADTILNGGYAGARIVDDLIITIGDDIENNSGEYEFTIKWYFFPCSVC